MQVPWLIVPSKERPREAGAKTTFLLRRFMLNPEDLPRQARDKHRLGKVEKEMYITCMQEGERLGIAEAPHWNATYAQTALFVHVVASYYAFPIN